jgi:hypothetical protein
MAAVAVLAQLIGTQFERKKEAMGCDELRRVLRIYGRESDIGLSMVATHIRTCPICSRGIDRLTADLLAERQDTLSCEQCRDRFPAYYEATRPEYPLTNMSDVEMAEVALHLGACDACKDQYQTFVLLSELEERDELVDHSST